MSPTTMNIEELFKMLFYDNTEWNDVPLYDLQDATMPVTPNDKAEKNTEDTTRSGATTLNHSDNQ